MWNLRFACDEGEFMSQQRARGRQSLILGSRLRDPI